MAETARHFARGQEVDDITQLAWVKYFVRFQEGRIPVWESARALRSVVRVLVHNAYVDRIRKADREQRALEGLAASGLLDRLDESRLPNLNQYLDKLSEKDYQILIMHYWQKMNLSALAKKLGISYGNAATRLFRARKRLEDILQGDEPAEKE